MAVVTALLLLFGASSGWASDIKNDQIGFSPNHVFDGSLKGESIDVLTGNVNLRIPIGPTYKLNDQLSYQVQLYYNSKIWEHDCSQSTNCDGEIIASDTYGLGFNIHFGRIYQHPTDKASIYRYQSPSGGEHFICNDYDDCPDVMRDFTLDSASIGIEGGPGTWALYPGDGTRIEFGHYVNADRADNGWYATRIETVAKDALDAPQQWVEITYGTDNEITTIEDSADRTITFSFTNPLAPAIQVPAFGVGTADYVLNLSDDTVQDPKTGSGTETRAYLDSISLPTVSETYSFTYESVGYLNKWTLPTGAFVEYKYKHYQTGPNRPWSSEMVMKTLTANGVTSQWTYTRFGDGIVRDDDDYAAYRDGEWFSGSNAFSVRVLDPDDNLTVYLFHTTFYGPLDCNTQGECVNNWDDGLLAEVSVYAGPTEDGARLVQRTSYDYTHDGMFQFREPVGATGQNKFRMGINVRTESVETYTPGAGEFPSTTTRVVSSNWTDNDYIEDANALRIPRERLEYVGQTLVRSTYTNYPDRVTGPAKHRNQHTYRATRDAAGESLRRTYRRFEDGRVICEATRAMPYAHSESLDCEDMPSSLASGDVGRHRTYDEDTGHLEQSVVSGGDDDESHTTSLTYSPGGILETSTMGTLNWDAVDRTIDLNTGLVSVSRSPAGIDTAYSWDALGRLTNIDPRGAHEKDLVISYPNLKKTVVGQDVVAGTNYSESRYYYDDLGRLIEEQRRTLTGGADYRKTEYDAAGKVTRRSVWAACPVGGCEDDGTTSWGTVPFTTFEYQFKDTAYTDPFGRVSKVTRPDGGQTQTEYLGLARRVTQDGIQGPDGTTETSVTTFVNDALGRLVDVDSPGDGADAKYFYDTLDNLERVELHDPTAAPGSERVQTREFVYDLLGRLRFATNPENGTTEYQNYDARGNLLRFRDAEAREFTNSFDEAGRLLEKHLVTLPPDETSVNHLLVKNTYDDDTHGDAEGQLVVQESYDEVGSLVATKRYFYGELGTISECTPGIQTPSYLGLNGRLARVRTSIAPWNYGVEQNLCYDQLGNLGEIQYPDEGGQRTRSRVGYLFHNGYLWEVNDQERNVEYLEDVAYAPGGAVTQYVRGNDVTDSITIDEFGRPTQYDVTTPSSQTSRAALDTLAGCAGGQGIVSLQFCGMNAPAAPSGVWSTGGYTYDDAGNIATIGSDVFGYDPLGRLVEASISRSQVTHDLDYSYDAFGNMLQRYKDTGGSADIRDYTVEWQSNRLAQQSHTFFGSTDVLDYEFDAVGNMTRAGDHSYDFDALGRLVKISDGDEGIIARYFYDADGYRVRSIVANTETFYIRDTAGQLLSEFRRAADTSSVPGWDKDYIYALGSSLVLIKNETPAMVEAPWVDGVTYTGLTLHWNAVDEPDIYQYYIEREFVLDSKSNPQHTTFKVYSPTTSYVDTFGFSGPETTITYRVHAVDNATNHGQNSTAIVVQPQGSPPPVPANLAAYPTDRALILTWNSVSDDDLWGYRVEQEGPPDSWTVLTPVPVQDAEYTAFGLDNGTDYTFRVRAVDTSGRESLPSAEVTEAPEDNVPPPRPLNVSAKPARAAEEIEISWDPSLTMEPGAEYRIMRTIDGGAAVEVSLGACLQVTSSNHPTSCVDTLATGVTKGESHCYTVTAIDAAHNESLPSTEQCARPRHPDVGGGAVPTVTEVVFENDSNDSISDHGVPGSGNEDGCDIVAEEDDQFRVKVSFDVVTGVDDYRIYRAVGDSQDFEPLQYDSYGSLECGPFLVLCCEQAGNTRSCYDDQIDGPDYRYYVVGLDFIGNTKEESAAQTEPTDDSDRATDFFDSNASVRNLYAKDGSWIWPWTWEGNRPDRHSRAITIKWSRVMEPGLVGYHVYRRCDWTFEEPGFLGLFWYGVMQHEMCPDAWVRLTSEPLDSERVFEDRTIAGLGGSFLYAVRPVGPNGEEGAITKAVAVDSVPRHFGGWEGRLLCDPDWFTHDVTRPFPLSTIDLDFEIATSIELARVNSIAQGSVSPDGPPAVPTQVSLSFGYMPNYHLNCATTQDPEGNWHYSWGRCGGYVDRIRSTKFAKVTWGPDPTQQPSDLTGHYIELAGSPDGPWRRVTPAPVAKWETQFSIAGVGVERYQSSGVFSGNLDCLSARVVAVDDNGNESPPVYATNNPSSASCPATPPAPEGLWASTVDPPSGKDCATQLQWNGSANAATNGVTYHIYRLVYDMGRFFYETQSQAATKDDPVEVETYDELGDGDTASADPNQDCPIIGNQWAADCWEGAFSAFYVTASYPGGGESPRSNIVRWTCSEDPGFANNHVVTDGVLLAESPPDQDRTDVAQAQITSVFGAEQRLFECSTDGGFPAHIPDTVDELSGPNLASAPLVTLGQSNDPPYSIWDLHVDHLGSTRVITNDAGQIASQHDFFPFGEEVAPAIGYADKLYTGHERDRETGLDYMLARYYGSGLGRFLSVDPVVKFRRNSRFPQRWNRYAYVLSNPLKYIDPDGEDLFIVYDFSGSGLSGKQQNAVVQGVRQRFRNAGVNVVQSYFKGGSTIPKKGDLGPKDQVVNVQLTTKDLGKGKLGHTDVGRQKSTVTTANTPGGEAGTTQLVNTTAHEVAHGTQALPQYDYDGASPGSPLHPEPAEEGTVMETGLTAEQVGEETREFSEGDAAQLRENLNPDKK